jgi:SPP1 family predicted phage head-tail adaptor
MRARGFNKRVEIWGTSNVSDGFSGYTVEETLLTTSWAKIDTVKPNRGDLTTDIGILDASNSIIVTLRKREDITYDMQTQFIKYRGEKYIINSYPANIDFKDNLIKIVCVKESNNASGEDLNADLNV